MSDKKDHIGFSDFVHEQTFVHKNHYSVNVNVLLDDRTDRGLEKERSHVESDIRAEKKGNDRKPKNKK